MLGFVSAPALLPGQSCCDTTSTLLVLLLLLPGQSCCDTICTLLVLLGQSCCGTHTLHLAAVTLTICTLLL